jgi:inner membrane protein
MDPVSQGVLGAAFAQTRGPKRTLAKAAAIGAFAGMVPDLDVLIRSSTDPLLAIDFHRHFTHSLFFIPIGGLLCSLVLYPLLGKRWQLSYRQVLVWCLIGFATHGVLDGFTTFGTQLLWPFDDRRYALDIISVVDPMFTVPLLAMVVLAAVTRTRRYAGWGLLWGAVYLSVGYVQHQRAETMGIELAEGRGHKVLRLEVKPTIGNLAVWKVVYETDERFFVDAVKPGLFKPVVWHGDSVPKLDVRRDFPWLDPGSQQARDIGRFTNGDRPHRKVRQFIGLEGARCPENHACRPPACRCTSFSAGITARSASLPRRTISFSLITSRSSRDAFAARCTPTC